MRESIEVDRACKHYFVLTAALLVLICFHHSSAERLPVKTYTVAEGSLRDEVSRIEFDSRGFLWLCSPEGLSRFDGYSFTNFTTLDGLPDRHVNDILESRTGEYWIGTDAGLVRLNPSGARGSADNPLFVPAGLSDAAVNVIYEDTGGTLWVGTNNGLFRLGSESSLHAVDLGPLHPGVRSIEVSAILGDTFGNLWVGTRNVGLVRVLSHGAVQRLDSRVGLPGDSITSLLEDDQARLWIAFRLGIKGGLARLRPATDSYPPTIEKVFSADSGLVAKWVMSLAADRRGQIWVGSTGGLCSIDRNDTVQCTGYRSTNNLCDGNITSIAEDTDENLWLATSCGTKKWSRYGFTGYFPTDGISPVGANSIFETPEGELIVSGYSSPARSVSRFDGNKFELVRPRFPAGITAFGWGWKQTVLFDSAGTWWFPTGQGLFRFPAGVRFEDLAKSSPEKISLGGKAPEIFRVYEDSRRDVWVATWSVPRELWRWERESDRWINHTQETGVGTSVADYASFVEDRHGNLWIGTGSDYDPTFLIRYRNGRFRAFSKDDNGLIAGWLRDLYVDSHGRLWIASTSSGLLRLDDVTSETVEFVRYTVADGLSSNGIYCVTEDLYGRIYAGSGRGTDRLDPETRRVENFTTGDGLPQSYVSIAYRDRRGDIWFGTANGIARFVPEPTRVREPPKTFISGFQVSGASRKVSILGETELPTIELTSDDSHVTVDFFGIGSNIGETLRFEYQLLDSGWIPTKERSVDFASLSPGSYRFEVRSVTADGVTSAPAVATFTIPAPIWQRWWFLLLMAVIIGSVVYMIYRTRLTRLLEIERTRTRIATDLHDDIGSNLSTISLLSEIVRMQLANGSNESKKMLATIAEASRSSVDSMRDIVWSINPTRDSVLEMRRKMREYAEDVCVPKDILVKFNAPVDARDSKLPMELRREVFLIFKEAVNNAVRHSGCSILQVDLGVTHSHLCLKIADNGHGFDPDREFKGNGLENIRRRAGSLFGSVDVESSADSGTTLSINIPV